ncbi:MAG TPA: ribonuclease Z [Syntrophorhabdaceae bacterium]|jgi:ribonuclease BN (tRNA processing enzyme)
MKVTFLGTNGWYDTGTGNTVSVAVETASALLVLDAGFGIAKLDEAVARDKPVYIFLSHLHLDHIVGLHVASAFTFPRGLYLCGQEGLASILGGFLDAPFTTPLKDFNSPVTFVELPRDREVLPFRVTSLPLVHSVPTLGYRFEIDGKVLAYIGDTGYCAAAVELAKGADLLITECAYKSGQENDDWPHLNPESAARIAREGGAKRLALVHFEAKAYGTLEEREEAGVLARKVFSETVATWDGLEIDI